MMTPNTASPDTVRAMSPEMFFDFLGVRLDSAKAAAREGVRQAFNSRSQELSGRFVTTSVRLAIRSEDASGSRCSGAAVLQTKFESHPRRRVHIQADARQKTKDLPA